MLAERRIADHHIGAAVGPFSCILAHGKAALSLCYSPRRCLSDGTPVLAARPKKP